MFVAPSPKNATATRGSPRSWNASAAPVICGSPPPTTAFAPRFPCCDVVEMHRAAVAVRAALGLPVELGHQLVRMGALRERVTVRAVRRGDHVAVRERAADADGAGLLADRDVQESGQLAGAETLLDLLLEAPNEEHLPQDVLQLVLAQRGLLFLHLCHGGECTVRAMRLAEQWNAIEQRLDPRWRDARLELAIEDETQRSRVLALLAPAGPGGSGNKIRFDATRSGAGVGPEAVRRLARRIDDEGIGGTLALVLLAPGGARCRAGAGVARGGLGRRDRRRCRPTGATSCASSS